MTSIEWTEKTWNPVTGCDRTSPGCDNCYALAMAKRLKGMGQPKYQNDGDPRTSGPGFGVTCHPDELARPLGWKKPQTVFVNSMSDLFHKDVPDPFIAELFAVMAVGDRHTFQILTKRPQRMAQVLAPGYCQRGVSGYVDHVVLPTGAAWTHGAVDYARWQEAFASLAHRWAYNRVNAGELSDRLMRDPVLPNVWLGTSIENDNYCFRADHLRATPAAVRFLSCEPLLGPLPSVDFTGVDWVIIGAESGRGARPMHNDWARDIRDRALAAGAAVFVKQLSGGHHAIKEMADFPADLRIRDYPKRVQ